jgi:hypothetical protein
MNVKVTAMLTSPLVLSAEGYGPELDAVVEWCIAQRQRTISESSGGRHLARMSRADAISKPGTLWTPFERESHGKLVIPRVSSCILPEHSEHHDYIAKRFPLEMLPAMGAGDRTGKVNITGGEYKSWYLPLRTTVVDRICWFAALRSRKDLGDAPMSVLRRWLKRVSAVGKKSAHGYGRVVEWRVEPIEHDYSWFADSPCGQVLMRRLPVNLITDNVIGWRPWYGGCCPPYWERSFHVEIAVPC